MIGTRKSQSMFVLKDLPSLQIFFSLASIAVGICLLVWQLRNYFDDYSHFRAGYFVIGCGLVVLGIIVLGLSTTTIILLNRELGVVTVSYKTPFNTSYAQYSYGEIPDGFVITTEYLFGNFLPFYRIN